MSTDTTALKIIIASYRALADQLEALPGESGEATTPSVMRTPHVPGSVFDPEHDQPPVMPDPHGTPEQVDWGVVMFFGRLWALNKRQNRGATPSERTAIARAAGYLDARGFAGWTWTWKDREDGRWITGEEELTEEEEAQGRMSGMQFLREYAEQLNVRLPDDLATWVAADEDTL